MPDSLLRELYDLAKWGPTAANSNPACIVFVTRTEAKEQLASVSLGANQALKLAGEMGVTARRVLAGVCAVSTPIDLRACSLALEKPGNAIYQRWFTRHMLRRKFN